MHVDLMQILKVDEKESTITVKLILNFAYHSNTAKWNSTEYSGLDIFITPPKTFWTPPICKIFQRDEILDIVDSQTRIYQTKNAIKL